MKSIYCIYSYLLVLALILALPLDISANLTNGAATRNEADTFISKIPPHLQDIQCEAVLRAVNGDYALLEQIRNQRNPKATICEGVDTVFFPASKAGVKMRLCRPSVGNKKLPLLIYLHGGGWCFGSINSCSAFCSSLAKEAQIAVLAIDYSLSPENPIPTALNDCISSFLYVIDNAEEIGIDPNLVSIGGDSAGGNLAISTALALNGNPDTPNVHSVVAYYPVVTTDNGVDGSWEEYGKGFGLDASIMSAFSKAYISPASGLDINEINLIASPLKRTEDELRHLPRTLIVSAERDILYDQATAFVNKANAAGTTVLREVIPGSVHLFITVDGQPSARQQAINLTTTFLR